MNYLQAYLRGISGSVPDYGNKVSIAIKSHERFGFLVHIEVMFTSTVVC